MKKILSLISLISFIASFPLSLSAQQWKAGMEPQKVFIENKSQFDGQNVIVSEVELLNPQSPILFGTENGSTQIFFTKNGLTYRFIEKISLTKEEREEIEKEELNP